MSHILTPRQIGLNYRTWAEYLADCYPDAYHECVSKYLGQHQVFNSVRVLQSLNDPQIERAIDQYTTATCYGCQVEFTVDSEDFRAAPDTPPELIYCDSCNEEARQWCERVEANW